jgi:DNA repair exonuclease SbcCD ATPase subunit
MTKTKVDDFLIEMISPKVKEIEEKFTSNQALTQDDINTLLLKSQYNHINHLDMKLDEVTADVASLKSNFLVLENRFDKLEQNVNQRFETFEQKFETFEQRFETFEQKMETTIQKALNKNMMLLIAVIGLFLTLSKIIDKF